MDEDRAMLRQALRNQRAIMLALMRMLGTGMGHGASSNELWERVAEMEKHYIWIARPSQKIE